MYDLTMHLEPMSQTHFKSKVIQTCNPSPSQKSKKIESPKYIYTQKSLIVIKTVHSLSPMRSQTLCKMQNKTNLQKTTTKQIEKQRKQKIFECSIATAIFWIRFIMRSHRLAVRTWRFPKHVAAA